MTPLRGAFGGCIKNSPRHGKGRRWRVTVVAGLAGGAAMKMSHGEITHPQKPPPIKGGGFWG